MNHVFDLAWVGVVGAAYAAFLGTSGRPVAPWQLVVCFSAGALFAAMPFIARQLAIEATPARRAAFFGAGSVLLIIALQTSGLPGSFGILPLPLVSYAAFSLPWSAAALVTIGLFSAAIGTYLQTFEHATLGNTAIPYGSAYLFTVVLSVAGRQAFSARAEAEILSRELTEANVRLHEQARQADALATARERNRLAREIHDGLGHYLTVIKVHLDAASAVLRTQPETAQRSIETAARLAGESLDDVRHSVGTLRSETARPTLQEALQQLASQSEPTAQIHCSGPTRALDPAIEHALYRAAQEGLTNVRKHARASMASVTLEFRAGNQVRLEVADDGIGPPDSVNKSDSGFGLSGLRERFALLGGSVELQPRAPRGSTLVAEVPA